eukprot:TRINITY_DN699_c0_g1_i1.p1 TRINITY_DN699_c0_g1~~TRINITY_DN699_c0_g1_i1.p1  ORF type:complete len:485 (+),score=87.72 TRINITY_DN699_c0_g1_i1:1026-2480(+)
MKCLTESSRVRCSLCGFAKMSDPRSDRFAEDLSNGLVGHPPLHLFQYFNCTNSKEMMQVAKTTNTSLNDLKEESVNYLGKLAIEECLAKVAAHKASNLPAECIFAVYAYTRKEIYDALNKALRRRKSGPAELLPFRYLCICLVKAMALLPECSEKSYRGIQKVDRQIVMTAIQKGLDWIWAGFSSTTLDIGVAGKFGKKFRFVIRGIYGRDISAFSQYPGEREILFIPGTCMRVLEVTETECVLQEQLVTDHQLQILQLAHPDGAAEHSRLLCTISELEKQVQTLRFQKAQAVSEADNVFKQQQSQHQGAIAELSKQRDALLEEKDDAIKRLQSQITLLRQDSVQQLQQQESSHQSAIDKLTRQSDAMRKEKDYAAAVQKELQLENSVLRRENVALRQENAACAEQLKNNDTARMEQEHILERLKLEVQSLRQEKGEKLSHQQRMGLKMQEDIERQRRIAEEIHYRRRQEAKEASVRRFNPARA